MFVSERSLKGDKFIFCCLQGLPRPLNASSEYGAISWGKRKREIKCNTRLSKSLSSLRSCEENRICTSVIFYLYIYLFFWHVIHSWNTLMFLLWGTCVHLINPFFFFLSTYLYGNNPAQLSSTGLYTFVSVSVVCLNLLRLLSWCSGWLGMFGDPSQSQRACNTSDFVCFMIARGRNYPERLWQWL